MLINDQKTIIKSIRDCFSKYEMCATELIYQLDIILSQFDDTNKMKLLKKSECLVDKHQKKSHKFIKNLLAQKDIPEYLKQYLNEVIIINKLFKECNRLQKKINSISPDKRMSALLVAAQIMRSATKNSKNSALYYDKVINCINSGFKGLIYDTEIFNDNEFIYGEKDYFPFPFFDHSLKIANEYVRNSINSVYFEIEYNEWKNGYRSFNRKYNKITSSISDKSIDFSYKTAIKDNVISHLFNLYFMISQGAEDDFLNDFDNFYEYSKFILERKFFCNCSNVKIHNIPISDWLKSYFALKKYISTQDFKYKYEKVSLFKYGIKNKLSKSKKEWIDILVEFGVSKVFANTLFDFMTFKQKSVDLFDDPFVPCCGKYFVIPWLIEEMEPGLVLLSKLADKKGIDFKGYSFENYILESLKYLEIPAIKLEHKEKGTPYQCDVAFLIDDTLFLCECKNRGSTKINDLLFDEIDDDVQQIGRIADFYSTNPNIVKNCFHRFGYKNINYDNIQKIVIYSKVTHGTINKNGTLIMDIYKFLQPLGRDEMTDYLAKKYPEIKDCLTNNITSEKIIKYYKYDVHFSDYSNLFQWNSTYYKLGKHKISTDKMDSGNWVESIDYDFLFKYCMYKKMKLCYVQEMYESGKIPLNLVPPELRKPKV